MTTHLLRQHLTRAWSRHWALQIASVTIMTVVLMIMNLLFLGYSAFNRTVTHWGQGLEMTVYLKEGIDSSGIERLQSTLEESGEFDEISFTPKKEATKKFLESLGPDSLELLKDPKWTSPIPASFEIKLTEAIPADQRVNAMKSWSAKLRGLEVIDDVFYGQGWIENFSSFLASMRWFVIMIWGLSLSVGLLIVSNCIRLSFLQRREEIEVLELVGATSRFIRTPFLFEGMFLGLLASAFSICMSYVLHTILITWMGNHLTFWMALQGMPAIQLWHITANLLAGISFGALGAWNCVRKLNTGWSAAAR